MGLGQHRSDSSPVSVDISVCLEVYLEDRWSRFDPHDNPPRAGRALMAVGRDASDMKLTTSLNLLQFTTIADELPPHDAAGLCHGIYDYLATVTLQSASGPSGHLGRLKFRIDRFSPRKPVNDRDHANRNSGRGVR